jgi:hypothetical protein
VAPGGTRTCLFIAYDEKESGVPCPNAPDIIVDEYVEGDEVTAAPTPNPGPPVRLPEVSGRTIRVPDAGHVAHDRFGRGRGAVGDPWAAAEGTTGPPMFVHQLGDASHTVAPSVSTRGSRWYVVSPV